MNTSILLRSLIISLLMGIIGTFNAQGENIKAAPEHHDITHGMIIKSVYSTQFGNVGSYSFEDWSGGVTASIVQDTENNNIVKYENLGYQPIVLGTTIDISSATHLNIDIYSETATNQLNVRLISPGTDVASKYDLAETVPAGEWYSVSIPLNEFKEIADYTLPNFESISAIQIAHQNSRITAYVDNIFFYDNNADPTQIEAATSPTFAVSDVVNFYSTQYGTGIDLAYARWGGTTHKSSVHDKSGNPILEFSRFNYIAMQYNLNNQLLSLNGKTKLHMAVYPDKDIAEFKLKLFRYADRPSSGSPQIETPIAGKNLTADKWNYLDFDISEFYNQADGGISVILLDGGNDNANIYVDHIFFYEGTPPVTEEIPAAEVPLLRETDVVNFYSTKYGMDDQLSFQEWGAGKITTAKDLKGNDVLKFTGYNLMGILYRGNTMTLNINNTDMLHLEVYPIKDITTFKVKLVLYKSPPEQNIEFEYPIGNLSAGEWHSFDIDISKFGADSGYKLTAIQPIVAEGNGEFCMDHIYFYNSQSTPPTEDEPPFPAYTPPVRSDSNVFSVFSNSYTSIYSKDITYDDTGINTKVEVISFGGNKMIIKLTETNRFPIKLEKDDSESIDVSQMDTLHIDIYSEAAEEVSVFLKGGGIEKAYPVSLTAEKWNRINIPLSFFQSALRSNNGVDLKNLEYVGIENGKSNTFFVDNIYFFKKQAQPTIEDIHVLNKKLGNGINLGTIFDDLATEWEDGFLDLVKEKGFDHIRLPIRWDYLNRSMEEAPYNIDEKFILEMQRIIDLAIKKGLPVIINMHNYDPLYENPDTEEERFLNMWGQIAEYFQHYDPSWLVFEVLNEPKNNLTPDLWNKLLPKALAKIRETNPNRAVLIGTAEWGGLGALSQLEWPKNDNNLILTIHYYEPFNFTHQGQSWMDNPLPAGITWSDTQSERDAVDRHFAQIEDYRKENGNMPVHIGEFGAFHPGDIDSRVLWATYISNRIKDSGYSSAYWDFHFYLDNNGKFGQSIEDALFKHKVPLKPTEFVEIKTLYDSKEPGNYSWTPINSNGANSTLTNNDNGFIVEITNGGSEAHYIQALLEGLNIEKDKTYQVVFNAKTNNAGFTFITYLGLNKSPWTYNNESFSPGIEEKTFSYIYTHSGESNSNARMIFDLGKGSNPVDVTISDITIKEISTMPAANIPELNADKVLSVFSSHYTDNLPDVNYPANLPTKINQRIDAKGNSITSLSDFDNQTIDLGGTLLLGDKKGLHLSVYPGSFLDLVITAVGEGVSQIYNYTLKPHDWNEINIDLSGFLSKTGGKISKITLSGGVGEGQKLYFDHIYFYYKSDSGSTEPEEPTAPTTSAPRPAESQSNVISIFSDSYTDIISLFDQLEGQTTKVQVITVQGDNTWKLTTPNVLSINVGNTNVAQMKALHLNVWTAQTELFRLYLSDGSSETPAIELVSNGQKWTAIDIQLPELQQSVDLMNIKSIRIETNNRSTFYIDNLYFHKETSTGNAITQPGNSIQFRISGNDLLIESPMQIQSISVFDTTGRTLIRKPINATTVSVPISHITNNIYFLQVICSNGEIKTFKFVKK